MSQYLINWEWIIPPVLLLLLDVIEFQASFM